MNIRASRRLADSMQIERAQAGLQGISDSKCVALRRAHSGNLGRVRSI